MNVLFLSELLHPHGGGAELATYLYSRMLAEKGFNTKVVTNRFAGEPEVAVSRNLAIHRLPLYKESGALKYSMLLRSDLLFTGFMKNMIKWADVVYIPRFWYAAIPIVKSFRKPVVVHLHDYIPICPLSNRYDVTEDRICGRKRGFCSSSCIYAWEKINHRGFFETFYSTFLNSTLGVLWGRWVRLSDAIVCVSETQRNIILDADGTLRPKTHVIYNPVPDTQYVPIENNGFGYFGGFSVLKGFHVLYRAARLADSSYGRATNIHVTNFSRISSACSDNLRKTGFVLYQRLGEKEYEELYREIRCVIVPSIWPETFSYVVIEALLRGRIVVASDIGAIPEVSKDCDGVMLFTKGDSKQLAEKMLYVKDLADEVVSDLGMRNREKIRKRFNNEKSIGAFAHLLNTVA